jgi:hypothetical protein
MPRNPDQDRDRAANEAQGEDQSQAKDRDQQQAKDRDQQGKAGSNRPSDTAGSSREGKERVPGQAERGDEHQTTREEDEEIADKMSKSDQDNRSKGGS